MERLLHRPSIDPDRVENPRHRHLKPSIDRELDTILSPAFQLIPAGKQGRRLNRTFRPCEHRFYR